MNISSDSLMWCYHLKQKCNHKFSGDIVASCLSNSCLFYLLQDHSTIIFKAETSLFHENTSRTWSRMITKKFNKCVCDFLNLWLWKSLRLCFIISTNQAKIFLNCFMVYPSGALRNKSAQQFSAGSSETVFYPVNSVDDFYITCSVSGKDWDY